MMRTIRTFSIAAVALALAMPAHARAQDTTVKGITLVGNYDPSRDKISVAVLPIAGGTIGDSIRTIIQRDFDFSDRFTIVAIDSSDLEALRAAGTGGGLNYPLFARLSAAAIVQITPVPTGLHVSLHDVATARVVRVGEIPLASPALGRDWRMGVHRTADEIEKWITGKAGIAATRIAYMRGSAIRIVDSDGAFEITVPTEDMGSSPAWSPDGSALVYSTFGANSRIMHIDLATGRSRLLAGPTRNTSYITPSFSPDGRSIVYSRSDGDQADLYVTSVEGGGSPRRLTSIRGVMNTNPIFSPDGRRITYVSSALGRPELYIINADGTGADVLTNYDFDAKNYRSDPDWSADGRSIAYQERYNNRFQIRTIRVTGSTPKFLTSEAENEQPAWAPDARHIVFTSTRTGVRQLWIMDIETARFRQLTKSSGSRLASWSGRIGATP
jgi:TolB protein